MTIILGIESTAHTFGIGIVKNGKVLSNVSQTYTTEKGGIIPMESAKHHEKYKDELYSEVLKKAKIKAQYEGQTYELVPSFNFDQEAYERQSNGKGEYRNRGNKKILNIKYTPDFVGDSFIIECKGRANESFPIRWKLFKAYVHKHLPNVTLYKPQNQKECEETVNLILGKRKT